MTNKRVNFKQLGISGLERYGGYVYEEFMPSLRYPRAAKVYKEMADNDPVVGAIMYMSEMLIRKVNWGVESASDNPEDREAAVFLEECMNDMSSSWASLINEILSMFTYGFSFHEVIYKIRKGPNETNPMYKSKYSDGRIGWRKIPVRAQATLDEWEFNDDGDITAFIQSAPPTFQRIRIPIEKGLIFRTRVNKDNPEGKSLLRNAYRPWYFKKRIEEIEAIGVERDLAGLPTLTAPEGVDIWDNTIEENVALRNNAELLVRSVRRDSTEGVLLPFGWDFKLTSTGGARQFDTNAIINRYDNRIAITMLSDIVLIGSEKTGSFALAETKENMLGAALEAQLSNIVDVFNQYAVPNLFRLNNFPSITDFPRIKASHIDSPTIKEIALLLRSMGLDVAKDFTLQNYLRQLTGMPEISRDDFDRTYVVADEQNVETTQVSDSESTESNNTDDTVDNDFEQNDMAYTGQ